MTETPPLTGVWPVFQTPYHDDANESIDYATLEREIAWLLERGADGVVMAMVSEILRLSTDERQQLAVAACKMSRGRAIVSVGAESTKLAESYARHAENAGAAAVMAVPPVSTGVGEDELLIYFGRILRAIRIPVVVQDASGYVGRPIPLSLYARLLDEHGPDRVLFKPEATPIGPRLSALRDTTGGRAKVFEGTGGIALVDSFRRGIVGTMPGADLIDGLVALWRTLKAGDERRVYQISPLVGAIVAMQSSLDAFLAVEKHLLLRQGIFRNTIVRGPVGYRLDDETRAEVDRLFDLLTQTLHINA
jgi:4-hydroxy-tetrahydrodipicolinate synthase